MTLLFASGSSFGQTDRPANGDTPLLRDFLNRTISESDSFSDHFEAEVWLVDMSRRLEEFVADHQTRLSLLKMVYQYATHSGLTPELVLAVIEVESHFDNFAVSRVGAQGLMQVMPFWKNEIGRSEDNLTHIATNLNYGCRILQFYLHKENGKLLSALARYNGSSNFRYSNKVRRAWQDHWRIAPLQWEQ